MCDLGKLRVFGHRLPSCMYLQNFEQLFLVRIGDIEYEVKPAGPQQRCVDYVYPVRGRKHQYLSQVLNAVHLREQLAYDSLRYPGPVRFPPRGRKRVDFVEEDYARRY